MTPIRRATTRAKEWRESASWISVFFGAFVVATVGGWLLPDGLNWVAARLRQPEIPVTALTRFFSLLLLFVGMAAIDLMVWLRKQARDAIATITEGVSRSISDSAAQVTESALACTLLPHRALARDQAVELTRVTHAYSKLVTAIPDRLFVGLSVLLEDGLSDIGRNVDDVLHAGRAFSVQQHLEITRRLATRRDSFLQINRKAFNVPSDWTQEWLDFVDEMGTRSKNNEYIVLMEKEELERSARKLAAMAEYLLSRNWRFRCCEAHRVRDALGEDLPTHANVDVYGGGIAKLQQPPKGDYVGGVKLTLRLVDLERDPQLERFIATVKQFALARHPS